MKTFERVLLGLGAAAIPRAGGVLVLTYISTSIAAPDTQDATIRVKAALPYAELSSAIYDCADTCKELDGRAGRWLPLLDSRDVFKQRESAMSELQTAVTANSTPAVLVPDTPMGFRAAAYRNPQTNDIAIVYEGTSCLMCIKDWATNLSQPFWKPAQYSSALDFAQEVEKRFCADAGDCDQRITHTGHSLGGALAQYAAIKMGRKAYTFNAAGLWGPTGGEVDTDIAARAHVTHFRSKGYMFGQRLGTDVVPYLGGQFSQQTIDIPVALPLWTWDAFTVELATHSMERLRDQMFAMVAAEPNEDQRIEIAAPDVAENGAVIPVTVGIAGEAIREIALYSGDLSRLAIKAVFAPLASPWASVRVKMRESGDLIVIATTDDGRQLIGRKRVHVTGGTDLKDGPATDPRIKLSGRGDTAKMLMNSPMGATSHIASLRVTTGGQPLVDAETTPWLAMNPYFSFKTAQDVGGRFEVEVGLNSGERFAAQTNAEQTMNAANTLRQPPTVGANPTEVQRLSVDGKTVSYWPSAKDAAFVEFQADSKGYRNMYLLDCAERRFIWTNSVRLVTGQDTGNSAGAEWKELNPQSTLSNAVYEAACPQLSASVGGRESAAAESAGTKAPNSEVWDYGVGLVGAAMVADPGNDGAHQGGSSATSDSAGEGADPAAGKRGRVAEGGYTIPKMRPIQLEASKLVLPPGPRMVIGGEATTAPADPEMVSAKLRETLGATTQSEWIATHYVKKLLVDKETVHYGPSRLGTTYADLEFGTEFSNVYTLDCEKRQFLRTKTIKWSDGWIQDMPMGDQWLPLKSSTTEMNAVYDAICPQLLAAVSGTLPRVNTEGVESKDGDAVWGGAIRADRLEVKDSSVVSGKITEGKVPFKSSFGTVEVNVTDIRSFADGKIQLTDGTVLTGAFAGGSIEVATSVGNLKVPADEIVAIVREGPRERGATALLDRGDDSSPPTEEAARNYFEKELDGFLYLISVKKTNGQRLNGFYRMQVEVRIDCSPEWPDKLLQPRHYVWCYNNGVNKTWILFNKTENGWVIDNYEPFRPN